MVFLKLLWACKVGKASCAGGSIKRGAKAMDLRSLVASASRMSCHGVGDESRSQRSLVLLGNGVNQQSVVLLPRQVCLCVSCCSPSKLYASGAGALDQPSGTRKSMQVRLTHGSRESEPNVPAQRTKLSWQQHIWTPAFLITHA